MSLVGADLALSAPERTLEEAGGVEAALPAAVALHALPLGALLGAALLARTRERRLAARRRARALSRVEGEIREARRLAAREGGARVAAALRELRRELSLGAGRAADLSGVLARAEAAAYDPAAAARPLDPALADAASALAAEWAESARRRDALAGAADGAGRARDAAAPGEAGARGARRGEAGRARAGALLAAVALPALLPGLAAAAGRGDADAAALDAARAAYARALAEPERERRVAAFSEAAVAFAAIAERRPRSPELLADWGCAALGARDVGTAVLAFRRTLALEPGHARARQNLAWARAQMPPTVPVPGRGGGDAGSVLEAARASAPGARLLLAGGLFAVAALLLLPGGGARAGRRAAAALLGLAWAALLASVLLEPDPASEAVLLHGDVVLRAADSLGAPPVLARPLPAGTEARVLEERPGFTRVELHDGTRGWAPAWAIGRVGPSGGAP
jgi:ParB family chromosome partitioning protein